MEKTFYLAAAAALLLMVSSAAAEGIDVVSPGNKSYTVAPEFNITNKSGYILTSANFSIGGSNRSMVEDGDYFYNDTYVPGQGLNEVTFWARNDSGLLLNETVHFTLDIFRPDIQVVNPSDGADLSGFFGINATRSDNGTGIETANYTINTSGTTEGELNTSFNSSTISDGYYNITFNVTDSAGNSIRKFRQVTVDNTEPVLTPFEPSGYVSMPFTVNATWSDATSGVSGADFNVTNSSGLQDSGSLNGTVTGLAEGDYNISYNVTDAAGNTFSNVSAVSVTVETDKPNLTVTSPTAGTAVEGDFFVNASRSDSLSITSAMFSVGGISGNLNGTVNSTNLTDGDYTVTVNATDKAGNTAEKTVDISVDNKAPEVDGVDANGESLENGDLLDGTVTLSVDYSDSGTSVSTALFRFVNGSSVMPWTNISDGSEAANLATDNYNLSLRLRDESGNWRNGTEVENIEVDSTPPDPAVKVIDEGWTETTKVELECSDASKNTEGAVISDGSFYRSYTSTPVNFTIEKQGKNDLGFRCRDSVGHTATENRTIRVDSTVPSVSSVKPSNRSVTGSNERVRIDFSGTYSSIDASRSNVSGVRASLGKIEWSNGSLDLNVSSIDYGVRSYWLRGTVVDSAGNPGRFAVKFRTSEEIRNTNVLEGKMSSGKVEVNSRGIEENDTVRLNVRSSSTVSSLEFRASDVSGDASILVKKVDAARQALPDPQGSIYSVLEVDTGNLNAKESNLTFRVNNTWLQERKASPGNLTLLHLENGNWSEIGYKVKARGGKYSELVANPGDFSYFAVTLEKERNSLIPSISLPSVALPALNVGSLLPRLSVPSLAFNEILTLSLLFSISAVSLYILDLLGIVSFRIPRGLSLERLRKLPAHLTGT